MTGEALSGYLPAALLEELGALPEELCELRLRINAPAEMVLRGGRSIQREIVSAEMLRKTLDSLTRHSLYAREEELREGYFTLENGCRVGVCGRFAFREGQASAPVHITSVNIRVAREVKGAANDVMRFLYDDGRPLSTLLLSPPGLGKTTMLRDIARRFSENGLHVALADERCELAACASGVPSMDLGPRCDVLEACPKRVAVMRLIRAMAPEVIVTDELGRDEDAEAVLEAARCGVCVVASAHAREIEDALGRESLSRLLAAQAFERIIILGGGIGRVSRIVDGRSRCELERRQA